MCIQCCHPEQIILLSGDKTFLVPFLDPLGVDCTGILRWHLFLSVVEIKNVQMCAAFSALIFFTIVV